MTKQIFFFATKSDMLPNLIELENKCPLKYIKNQAYETKDLITYGSITDFDDLGINTTGNHQSESYLVLEKSINISIQEVSQQSGGIKYYISQRENQKSIVFWSGGLYGEKHLICGHVSTISNAPA